MLSPPESRPVRAGLYARVSTKEQSTKMQVDSLRALAAHRGWTVVDEYADDGISGATADRPQLQRLMVDARAGALDVVAVWRFDRFARSTQHLLSALDEFRALHVDFVSLNEQIDTTTPLGKALFTIVAAVAELERGIIRERIAAGLARASVKGTKTGKPIGRPRVELDRRAVDALLAQNYSVATIARVLGVPRGTLRARMAEWAPVGGPLAETLGAGENP